MRLSHITFLITSLLLVVSAQGATLNAEQSVPAGKEQSHSSSMSKSLSETLVHRKAAEKAAARKSRLQFYKQIGHSPSRPAATVTPFTSSRERVLLYPIIGLQFRTSTVRLTEIQQEPAERLSKRADATPN